ncbi:3-hydroxyisobutyrate dehydrogenase [Brevibacterium casei]|uniref:3-hydroxyisobutyrate dehydrogenase n=3 Tax=Brevibacterium casei TaxID=33889 RepID=K9ALU8_9MICO|nr:3-hydroxyisobutyrate dehydrogenase [Brevibacterium casei]NJE66279.1 3-hydroxyisobutyrate dehydrogenase [Brevibacterium sp. LS14]EKU48279.1 3-hydroxyisobutyrate dehydrogenase [Brevibacterium casei S18]KZE21553.1 3-hydroxyisobutyrate dehydrogenase [Brevibacterium casei]MBE4695013.1 3-hydroxyisobutyrate dehydrogenase [Brevibacterium casei]MBY3578135.1 3-hydroxyisobutyrate dehydrogenase [Brevibacterium casei]
MATIGWIGLGNMGRPMTANLVKAGHTVKGFDVVPEAVTAAAEDGVTPVGSIAEAVAGADIVFTMLPKGEHARAVYLTPDGVLATADPATLLVDSSTIDFDSARALHAEAKAAGFRFVDGPVSGGVTGAQAGTLTFMLGGSDADVAEAKPFIEPMAGNIFHAGGDAAGQAAKIVNNMMLAISLEGVVEGAVLAQRFGLDPKAFYDIAKVSSGDSWPLRTWYPVPGVTETSASNNDFKPGFATALMHKDVGLALAGAETQGVDLPAATLVYAQLQKLVDEGLEGLDTTAIIKNIDPEAQGLPTKP